MAKYRNIKNGAVIDSPSLITGTNWEKVIDREVEKEAEVAVEPIKEVVAETENTPEDLDGITKKEIMQELDAMGIEYDPRARKQELYDLMVGK